MKDAIALTLLVASLTGTRALSAQQPPVRSLGRITGRSSETFAGVPGVRVLSDGRVLVNDAAGRRLVLLDSSLSIARTVADTARDAPLAYGVRPGRIIQFRGDTSLFVQPTSFSMLVLDAEGTVARVLAVPRARDASVLASAANGSAAVDGRGRLVYRAAPAMASNAGGGPDDLSLPELADSAAVVGVDLPTRRFDTLAFVRVYQPKLTLTRGSDHDIVASVEFNPLPTVDEWGVLSDGTVAVVRGRDYRIELHRPGGRVTESRPVPFRWQRMSDDGKAAFLDSTKTAYERLLASGIPDLPPARHRADSGATTIGSRVAFVSASDLPDYRPAFMSGAVRADDRGHLWVRTTSSGEAPGTIVYDVLDGRGDLVDRIEIAATRFVAGFGPGDTIFLAEREAAGVRLERALLR